MILVLGGTTEGRELCAALDRRGISNLQSLAGRTSNPLLTASVRVGGFGGAEGLLRFLTERRVTTVVDATHPFAAGITRNAALACAAAGVRLLRVDRPGWAKHPHADRWAWVDSHAAAASTVVALGSRRVLLTVGRQHTLDYSPALDDRYVLARAAEPPSAPLPPAWRLELARGPFSLAGERRLFAEHQIDSLITKDSGGDATAAKLRVADEANAAVVMLRRPAPPEGVVLLPDVAAALALLSEG
ncbi:cobalt-precorrin-6A reductase [Tessaracoccus defluvii]|uniref:Cobalt-precorrin-6A reductase n=1 Tax=Tessaracoccus defluvii TaxID=1285901 RepID=A0A7H0H771_9ACTN|nr:cobalt-precorrin-6A reductase [Tessaracoccus defluvii]QNP56387.1 cobalt-precorrin-6A reductase [Tessaracoccus defluvii]